MGPAAPFTEQKPPPTPPLPPGAVAIDAGSRRGARSGAAPSPPPTDAAAASKPQRLTMKDESLVIVEDVSDDGEDDDDDDDEAATSMAARTPYPSPAMQMLGSVAFLCADTGVDKDAPGCMRSSRAGAPPCLLSPHPSSQPGSLRADPRLYVGWRTLATMRHTWKPLAGPSRQQPRPCLQSCVRGTTLSHVRSTSRRSGGIAAVVPEPETLTVLQRRPHTRPLGCPRTSGSAHSRLCGCPCTSASASSAGHRCLAATLGP
jgi:hypothetical protein